MGIVLSASAPASIEYLARLEHWVERATPDTTQPTDARVPSALVPKSQELLGDVALGPATDPVLQGRVKTHVLGDPRLARIRFALVDVTEGHLAAPKLAGNKLDETAFGASLIKAVAMFAAYQLQYDLNVLARSDPSLKDAEALFRAAYDRWLRSQVDASKLLLTPKGDPIKLAYASWNGATTWKRRRGGSVKPLIDGAPNLENIFRVVPGSAPLAVEFKQGKEAAEDGFAIGEFGAVAGAPFYERMLSMIDASNNLAAASCILDVGYLYMCSALRRAGFFSESRGGGLWLSATYQPGKWKAWRPNPLPMKETNAGKRFQVGSAAAVASFMTRIAQNMLVSPRASQEMKFLLSKQKARLGTETYSPVQAALRDAGVEASVYSKLGLNGGGSGRRVSDGAIVARKVEDRTLRYVVSLIDLPPEQEEKAGDLLAGLDRCVQENNGLVP